MGSSYTNITVTGADVESVTRWLEAGDHAAFVGGAGGAVLVFSAAGEGQDGAHQELAAELTGALGASALAALVHDSDLLVLALVRGGELVGQLTVPDPVDVFGPEAAGAFGDGPPLDAASLAAAFGVDAGAVEALLADEPVFIEETHAALCAALGLPEQAVGAGFRYLEHGELPDGIELRRVGPS